VLSPWKGSRDRLALCSSVPWHSKLARFSGTLGLQPPGAREYDPTAVQWHFEAPTPWRSKMRPDRGSVTPWGPQPRRPKMRPNRGSVTLWGSNPSARKCDPTAVQWHFGARTSWGPQMARFTGNMGLQPPKHPKMARFSGTLGLQPPTPCRLQGWACKGGTLDLQEAFVKAL
jgi:hypothetical protein